MSGLCKIKTLGSTSIWVDKEDVSEVHNKPNKMEVDLDNEMILFMAAQIRAANTYFKEE